MNAAVLKGSRTYLHYWTLFSFVKSQLFWFVLGTNYKSSQYETTRGRFFYHIFPSDVTLNS